MVFLTGRPLTERGRCTLGRETAIQEIEWLDDGWIYLKHGGNEPGESVEINEFREIPIEPATEKDDFDSPLVDINFQSLRIPIDEEWLNLSARHGFLRLYGRESLSSFHYQSLIARRIQDFHIEASTCLEFNPKTFQQMAGLVLYYNTSHYYYLYVSTNNHGSSKHINIISCDKFITTEPLSLPVEIETTSRIYLKAELSKADLQFSYSLEIENQWKNIGPVLDGSILSDDYVKDENNRYRPAFTGAFAGLCCQDLSGQNVYADFDWFRYKEIKH
ncbi:Beta-xylosidase [subsurface metagenome]